MTIFRIAFAMLLATTTSSAWAQVARVSLGHAAPGLGDVDFVVNDTSVGVLRYGEFHPFVLPSGTLTIEARDALTGELISHDSMTVTEDAWPVPLVMLTGNNNEAPIELRAYELSGRIPPAGSYGFIAGHIVAPYPGATNDEAMLPMMECIGQETPPGTGQSRFFANVSDPKGYGARSADLLRFRFQENHCILHVSHPVTGAFKAEAAHSNQSTLRLILIGDGIHEQHQVIVTVDGERTAAFGPLVTTPAAITNSQSVWYDIDHPAVGMSLKEFTSGAAVTGIQFEVNPAGEPVWALMNATREAGSTAWGVRLLDIGYLDHVVASEPRFGTLTFTDCNHLTLELQMPDASPRRIRMARSVPVKSCPTVAP